MRRSGPLDGERLGSAPSPALCGARQGRSLLVRARASGAARWARLRARPFGGAGTGGDGTSVVADVRLLSAALPAWAVVAGTLGLPPGVRATLAGAVLMLAAVCVGLGHVPAARWPALTVRARAGPARRPPAPVRLSRRSTPPGTALPRVAGLVSLVLTVTGMCLAASAAHGAVRLASPLEELAQQRATVTVTGFAAADAIRISTSRPSGATVLVPFAVRRVQGRGIEATASATVLVVGDDRWAGIGWHDGLTFSGRLSVADDPADREVAGIRPGAGPSTPRPPGLAVRWADHVRAGLAAAVSAQPADSRGLLPALVVGDTSHTPPELTEAMRATGMTHLSAVSGSNVAIVLVLVMLLCRLGGVPGRWRPVVGLLGIAGFVLLARPEPSVLRAAVMGGVALVGLVSVRRAAGLPVLAAAIVLLLCVDPWLARSYGFVLSTLATLGLLLFVRPWGAAIDRRLPARLGGLGQVVAIPAAAQLLCAPVIVLLQGSVSIVGIAANLLAAPLVAPATVAGVATALVAVVAPQAAVVVAWTGGVPALLIARIARVCAEVPGGTAPWPDGAPGAVLLAALGLATVLTGRWWAAQVRRHPLPALGIAMLVIAAGLPTRELGWPPPGWVVAACDVGQGDAIALRTGDTSAVLVDAGPDPHLVDGCLKGLGVRRLDAVVLTHFHTDHVDGLPGAVAGRTVGQILVSPVAEPAFQAREVTGWARQRGIPVRPVWAGDRLAFGTMTAQVWWPARRIGAGSVPNNASVVLSVQDGDVSALMLGDVEREAAHQVLLALRREVPAGVALSFDVLKVAHHGSANIDRALYAELSASVALVSVGEDNGYGHPASGTVALLRSRAMAVWRTDQHGTVVVTRRDGTTGVTSGGG